MKNKLAIPRFHSPPSSLLYPLLFLAVTLSHLTLLRLPYFWDEGGYYIPAALDFYRHGWLIPHFTNAHPPLPNIVLGTLWHITGFHILATRLIVCAFAAAALLTVFRLTEQLLSPAAAWAVTLLTAIYPIWFAQSTLAHADIFAAAFTLWAFALYIPSTQNPQPKTGRQTPSTTSSPLTSSKLEARPNAPHLRTLLATALLFSLAALSKETSILQPATLACVELYLLLRDPAARRDRLRRLAALSFPVLPLLAWYAYHHHITGFTFGNPEYLRYNATANLTLGHILQAIRYRFLHLFWQRNIWLPIVLALACLFLPRRTQAQSLSSRPERAARSGETPVFAAASAEGASPPSTPYSLLPIPCLILTNWLAFSVLGGALLTRYLLPIYPLILILCIYVWSTRTRLTAAFTAVTAAAFISAWWLNPPTSFAPEDNLTYRDMIVVHQQAIDFVAARYPAATVLTAWPVTADLFNPDLGYVARPIKAISIDDFTPASIAPLVKQANTPGAAATYDTAIVFTTKYLDPALRSWLEAHPDTRRGREFAASHDLHPEEIAALLGGRVVVTYERRGEWAAVLRFDRTYEARLGNITH